MLLLLLILLAMAFLIYFLNDRDILSPTLISVLLYFIATLFAIFGMEKWNYIKFDVTTIIVVTLAMLAMELGEVFARLLTSKNYKLDSLLCVPSKRIVKVKVSRIKIPKSKFVIALLMSIFGAYLYWNRVLEIAYAYGYSGFNLLFYVRTGLSSGVEKIGYFVVLMKSFAHAFGFISIYCFLNNVICENNLKVVKENIYYLLAVVPSITIYYISSSRYTFIKLLTYVLMCFLLLHIRKTETNFSFKLTVKFVSAATIMLFILYYVYKFTGESRNSFALASPIDKFLVYGGSSIVGLSEYIKNGMERSKFWGDETLTGLLALIQRFFPQMVSGTHILEFFRLNAAVESNIYTMIRSLIADYGILGMLIAEFLIGMVFSVFYKYVRRKKNNDFLLIIYAYLFYGIVYQIFTPLLLTDIGAIAQLMDVFWIIILYYIFRKHFYIKYSIVKNMTL